MNKDRLWQLMQHDKKIADGRIGWILPDRLGGVIRRDDVRKNVVTDALTAISST